MSFIWVENLKAILAIVIISHYACCANMEQNNWIGKNCKQWVGKIDIFDIDAFVEMSMQIGVAILAVCML